MTVAKTMGTLLSSLSPKGMTWDSWKPIIRCTVAAWIGLILMLVPRTLRVLGQASFLTLVVSCANPPSGSVIKVLYESVYTAMFVCLSWTWYVIAAKAATSARTHVYSATSLTIPDLGNYACSSTPQECFSGAIFQAEFIEGRSSIVYAFFLFFGSCFYFYLKVTRPTMAIIIIFGLVSLIIPHVYGPLFPYFYPELGQVVFIPMACQCAINVACALVFWPESMSHAYTKQIQGLLRTIQDFVALQELIMRTDPRDVKEWESRSIIRAKIRDARAGLAALGPSEVLLVREVQYGRLSADELRSLTTGCRDIILKLGGFSIYYDLVSQIMKSWNEKQEAGITTSARPSTEDDREKYSTDLPTPGTPMTSGTPRSNESIQGEKDSPDETAQLDQVAAKLTRTSQKQERHKHAHFNVRHNRMNLLHEALHHEYKPTGVFEMHHYVERELRFPRQSEVNHMLKMIEIARESTKELFSAITAAAQANCQFLANMNKDRFLSSLIMRRSALCSTNILVEARDQLQRALDNFGENGRLQKLSAYDDLPNQHTSNPYRPLLRMYYLEFTLVRLGETSLKLTQRCLDLELEHPSPRWHFPRAIGAWVFAFPRRSTGSRKVEPEDEYQTDLDEPFEEDMYQTEVRDPDHGPARHWYHLLGRALVRSFSIFKNPTVYFSIKASILVILVSLPGFLKSSASWFYYQRGLWAIIMASFTIAPFTGDTIFSFIFRVVGTLLGAASGCVFWYIGDGNGNGQPFGLAATMLVGFVGLMYIRLKWLYISPQPAIFLVITNVLIVGYSWQDTHMPSAANLGKGWPVAWRRFVVVMIGITAAFIWSFFPKPTTGRQVIRHRLASGATEIGNLYVRVSNFARDPHRKKSDEEEIRNLVVRANAKLLIIKARLQFATFEPPIQGPWPRDKYERIYSLQRDILDLLVAFTNNLTYMEHAWVDPLLRRAGWLDRELVGDCLAVLFMTANSIKTGRALPQIVSSPLIDRYYTKMDQLQESKAEGSLPQVISRKTMEDPGYASFAVGSVISFAIIHRIDQLLLVTKELVGEVWHLAHFANGNEYQRLGMY